MSGQPRVAVLIALCFVAISSPLCGQVGTVVLKDGSRYSGVIDRVGSILIVDDGMRLVFFSQRLLDDLVEGSDLADQETFTVKQVAGGRSGAYQVVNLAGIVKIEPFDEFGRRTVHFLDARRGEVALVQGIVKLTPRYAQLIGLNYAWEGAIATTSVPREIVLKLLHRSIDPKKFTDRVRVIHFLTRVGWLSTAAREVERLARDFPEESEAVQTARKIVDELRARRMLAELQIRRAAGQHNMVLTVLQQELPEYAPGDVVVEVRALRRDYERDLADVDTVRREVTRLLAQVNPELKPLVAPIVQELTTWVTVESLPRLQIFLDMLNDRRYGPEAKLGLALSGWLSGSAYAQPDLQRALRLWQDRQRILQYVTSSSELERDRLIATLRVSEGLTPELARELIRNAPPPLSGYKRWEPGVIHEIAVDLPEGSTQVRYLALLPPEYHPEHRYPMIVSLHGRVTDPKMQLQWWATQAMRYGYVVIAPVYLDDPSQGYGFSVAEHLRVIHAIRDAQLRFSIDANRVFLSGHYEGAEAAWDIGLGHPDLFAGVIPIAGKPRKFVRFYRPNARHVSMYIIDGQLNGNSPEQTRRVADPLMRAGCDMVYHEYKGRGREPFSDEILNLLEWMQRKRRTAYPLKVQCKTGRLCDDQFFYVTIERMMPALVNDPALVEERGEVKTGQVRVQVIRDPNTMLVSLNGPLVADIWLSPDVLDFSRRINLRINSKSVPARELKADIEPLLVFYRRTGDRQRAFFARVRYER